MAASGNCTECKQLIVNGWWVRNVGQSTESRFAEFLLYPTEMAPRRVAPEVESSYANDLRDAAIVSRYSRKRVLRSTVDSVDEGA